MVLFVFYLPSLLPHIHAHQHLSGLTHVNISSFLCAFCNFFSDLNEDPERRKRNPIPGCVDGDRDYQIFLLHIQPAPPPAVLHQMGQVEMPLLGGRDELELSLPCRTLCLSMSALIWPSHLWHASLPGPRTALHQEVVQPFVY